MKHIEHTNAGKTAYGKHGDGRTVDGKSVDGKHGDNTRRSYKTRITKKYRHISMF